MRISDWSSDVCSSDLTPPRLNDLLRGKFNRFSLDDLMTAATAAGIAPPAPRKSSWDDLRGIVKGNGARFTIEEINRSEEHTSELQSLMRISYAVFCLKKKKKNTQITNCQTESTEHKRSHTR